MTTSALIFLSFHEPWRIRVPVEPIPPAADPETIRACLFDEEATESFFQRWLNEVGLPCTLALRDFLEKGARFLINVSGPLLQMLTRDASGDSQMFLTLLRHPGITVVSSDLHHSVSFYLDIDAFSTEMRAGQELCGRLLERKPILATTPLMSINNEIYAALYRLGFAGVVVDGCWNLLRGRPPSAIFRAGQGPLLLSRHSDLSLKAMALLSAQDQHTYKVRSFPIANKLTEMRNDFLMLGWHLGLANSTGQCSQVEMLRQTLCEMFEQGITFAGPEDVIRRQQHSSLPLHLPSVPAVSAEFGNIFYFLGHSVQQEIFCLMHQAYAVAKLTKIDPLIEIAMRLAQWDILGLLHAVTVPDSNGNKQHYFTPSTWARIGPQNIAMRLRQSFEHFIQRVSDAYL